jgi:hypothetical protein
MGYNVDGATIPNSGKVPIEINGEMNTPTASPALTGPGAEGWYKSEFGCTVWPSFESIATQLPEKQWSMSSPSAAQRSWNVANVIGPFFGNNATARLAEYGEVAFKRQLYQSMISQVLFLKTEMEAWRSSNIWGSTFWMYNEIWPTGGWGSIEYGSPVPGQVVGGRWKPLHYILRSSTFADQLCVCNIAGACFITNDSPFQFQGSVNIRVLNMMTGTAESVVADKNLILAAGPKISQWFCATGSDNNGGNDGDDGDVGSVNGRPQVHAAKTSAAQQAPTYKHIYLQIPVDQSNFTKEMDGVDVQDCELACNADSTCLGFTQSPGGNACWLYSYAPALKNFVAADWWQKPGTKPIPAPPPPPAPPPAPRELVCRHWNATSAWKDVGCNMNGSNCVLDIKVTAGADADAGADVGAGNGVGAGVDGGAAAASWSTLPFVPPKNMQLPTAKVTAVVADAPTAADPEQVAIQLSANATALYVVLTTLAQGRFSDNVIMLEVKPTASVDANVAAAAAEGVATAASLSSSEVVATVNFISWAGPMNSTGIAILKSSLRVEHLADNL